MQLTVQEDALEDPVGGQHRKLSKLMLQLLNGLLTGLTTGFQSLFAPAFVLSALVPAFIFTALNTLIAILWFPAFLRWVSVDFFPMDGGAQAAIGTLIFFFVWIFAQAIVSLTPHWVRSLEGDSWPEQVRALGIRYLLRKRRQLEERRDEIIKAIADLDTTQAWCSEQIAQWEQSHPTSGSPTHSNSVLVDKMAISAVESLKSMRTRGAVVPALTIQRCGTLLLESSVEIVYDHFGTLLSIVAYSISASKERLKLINKELFTNYSASGDCAPTAFGNISMIASSHIEYVYDCSLPQFWGVFCQALETDANALAALQDCKTKLDGVVANLTLFFLSTVTWFSIFVCSGHALWGVLLLLVGSAVFREIWYSAAIEQNRLFQEHIIARFKGPSRRKTLELLGVEPPSSLGREREVWAILGKALDFDPAIGKSARSDYLLKK